MRVMYGAGFEVERPKPMLEKVQALQVELSKLPQYEPETKHYFHGGMYCREVFRHAGVLVVGAVHKKSIFTSSCLVQYQLPPMTVCSG